MQPDLLDLKEVCHFFGGSRPLHPATLYRGIRKFRYPGPIHVAAPPDGSAGNAKLRLKR